MKKTLPYRIFNATLLIVWILFAIIVFFVSSKTTSSDYFVQIKSVEFWKLNFVTLIALGFNILLGIVWYMLASFLIKRAKTKKTAYLEDKDYITNFQNNTQNVKLKNNESREAVKLNQMQELLFKDLVQMSDIQKYSDKLLSNLAHQIEIVQAMLFIKSSDTKQYKLTGSYAFYADKKPEDFGVGEGITGQVAKDKKVLRINNVPENYITVLSGLGRSTPKHLLIIPFIQQEETFAMMELSSFSEIPEIVEHLIAKAAPNIMRDMIQLQQFKAENK